MKLSDLYLLVNCVGERQNTVEPVKLQAAICFVGKLGLMDSFRLLRAAIDFVQQLCSNPRASFEQYQWVPPTILLIYYPNAYLHDVIRGLWLLQEKQKSLSHLYLPTLASLIMGPLLYHVLTTYSLLDNISWRGFAPPRTNDRQNGNHTEDSSNRTPNSIKYSDTDIHVGLSGDEVSARRRIHGSHELWNGRNWAIWVLRFNSNSGQVFILSGAILAIILHAWLHVCLIFLLWALMIYTPFYQQWNADDIVASLCPSPLQPTITLRNGKLQEIASKDLVPGDLTHVSEGSMIPADGRIVACSDVLQLDQSGITGDAAPISKHEEDVCYWGTGVIVGDALLQIEHTGLETFIGRTVNLIQGQDEKDNMQKALSSTSEYLDVIRMIGIIFLVLLALPAVLWQTSVVLKSWTEILSVTANMAIIAGRFFSRSTITNIRATSAAEVSKDGCIPQSIQAIETLAGIDTICIDSTGVLTQIRYILAKPYCITCDPEDVIFAASFSASSKDSEEPLDRVISQALKRYPQAKAMRDRYTIIDRQDVDLDLGRMYTQCLVEAPDGTRSFFAKGGPRSLLELCRKDMLVDSNFEQEWRQTVMTFIDNGFTAMGVARRREGGDWQLLGALPLRDLLRQSTRSALKLANELGVRVKVMFRSVDAIAEKVAQAIGLEASLLSAESIDQWQDNQSAELATLINRSNVYTEAETKHKEMILTVLQNAGHRVAVTGDSGSDIPALRKSDCGIAVAGSTELAQSASELVCTEKAQGLLPLMSAIKISRRAYQHAHDYVVRQTVRTLHVLLTMLLVFFSMGELLDLRLLLASITLLELSQIWLRPKIVDTSRPKTPGRWSKKEVLKEVGLFVLVITVRSWVCALFLPAAERTQVLSLSLAIGDLWMAPTMQADTYLWQFWQESGSLRAHLAICLFITVIYVTGLVDESCSLRISTAIEVWLFNVIIFPIPSTKSFVF